MTTADSPLLKVDDSDIDKIILHSPQPVLVLFTASG